MTMCWPQGERGPLILFLVRKGRMQPTPLVQNRYIQDYRYTRIDNIVVWGWVRLHCSEESEEWAAHFFPIFLHG